MLSVIKRYFVWIQKDVPRGDVEKYPELDKNGETSVKGIFVIGDLTGVPLLKLSSEGGVYFFLSGRVWCRFLCPLAALMHIYTRFSR
jgi:hypothetical protein